MTSENSLTALADRVQALTSACREMDYQIFLAVNPQCRKMGDRIVDGRCRNIYVQWLTKYVDAALTLTEPGAEISISTLHGVARVQYPLNFADHPPYQGEHVGGLIAPAICAAVLRAIEGKVRARAALENSHG